MFLDFNVGQRCLIFQADIESEYEELKNNLTSEVKSASWLEILRDKSLRTPTLISIGVMYFQKFSDIPFVMFYAKPVFMVIYVKVFIFVHRRYCIRPIWTLYFCCNMIAATAITAFLHLLFTPTAGHTACRSFSLKQNLSTMLIKR